MRQARRTIVALTVAGLLLASSPGRAQELPLEALLARIQQKYRAVGTLRAHFEQRTEARPGMAPRIQTGMWYMRSPGLVRLEYDDPANVLVADGKDLYWYLPEDRQVQVRSQEGLGRRGSALLYLTGDGNLLADFAASGADWRTKLAPGNVQIRLDPLMAEADYAHVLLEVDPATAIVVRLVQFGLFGDPNEFRFDDIATEVDLDDELFQFTVPGGVNVEVIGN